MYNDADVRFQNVSKFIGDVSVVVANVFADFRCRVGIPHDEQTPYEIKTYRWLNSVKHSRTYLGWL